MSSGIRAEVIVPDAGGCPLARTSSDGNVTAHVVSKSVDPSVPERVTEEFAIEPEEGAEDLSALDDVNATKIFETGDQSVYRFERPGHRGCPCECIETQGIPVVSSRAADGTLYLVFHTPDTDALRAAIGALRNRYPQVTVRRLVQSRAACEESAGSLEFFDRDQFTDRQEEVLRTAHRLGYFKRPKGANAGEIADELDITTATFIQHLSAAQQKLLDSILATEDE